MDESFHKPPADPTPAEPRDGAELPDEWRLGRPAHLWQIFALTLLLGLTYVILQWLATGTVADAWFVGLLLGATALLLQGMRGIHTLARREASELFTTAPSPRENGLRFVNHIFDSKLMALSGVLYGMAVAVAVACLPVWPGQAVLHGLVVAFVFVVNVSTGAGVCGIVRFFQAIWNFRNSLHVNLWQRRTKSTHFIDRLRTRIAMIAAFYVAMAQSSVLVSVIPFEGIVSVYAGFAAVMILAGFAMPGILVRSRLQAVKAEALLRLDAEVDGEFTRTLNAVTDIDRVPNLDRIKALLEFRDRVEQRSVWPFGWKSLRTAASVVLVTYLPVVLTWVVKNLGSPGFPVGRK